MDENIKILFLEDNPDDALLLQNIIRKGGYNLDSSRTANINEFGELISNGHNWDLIIADYKLPGFTGLEALHALKNTGKEIPFILVSGTIGEELAVNAMLEGAFDYLRKDNLLRLMPSIRRAVVTTREKAEKKRIKESLIASEEKYRDLVENINDIIFSADETGIITYISPAVEENGEFKPQNVIGKSIFDFVYKEDLDKLRKSFEDTWKGIISPVEIRVPTVNGEVKWVRCSARLSSGINRAKVLQGVITDITDRKNAEIALEKAMQEAKKSDRLKSEFLAQMSHEIRTPLNVITSFSSLLKEQLEEELDSELQLCFDSMESASKRIIRTIDLLLNMAEVQTGTFDYKSVELDLYEDILIPVFTEFKKMAEVKGLAFTIFRKTEQTKVRGDIYSLKQMFSQLADNAIKYTNEGGVRLLIYDGKADTLKVSVVDTGIGISEEYQKILFVPFSQEQQGYTRPFDGNGLGLSLVKSFADLNESDISVYSQKGSGTSITLEFKKIIEQR